MVRPVRSVIRPAVSLAFAASLLAATLVPPAMATSQWSRKTGMECIDCHTVFPRLNPTGEKFLREGYVLYSAHGAAEAAEPADVPVLDNVSNLLGFRLNMTPIQWEKNGLLADSSSAERTGRLTIGNPIWIQFFAAGHLFPHVSFFSELEYAQSSFKFNWFYFNFTRLGDTPWVNAQVGNVSPLEFASFPNRLPQYPALKGEVMLLKSSNGKGDEGGVDMSSARPGIQYFGHSPNATIYAGVSPGPRATDVNDRLHYWGGLVGRLSEGGAAGFGGTSATIHYYHGVDTNNRLTGVIENTFFRVSPQINVRYDEKVDLQLAYVYGEEDNRGLVAASPGDAIVRGTAAEISYMPDWRWQVGLHHDRFKGRDAAGALISDYHRIVPGITYVLNQNWRATAYYEHDLKGTGGSRGPAFNNKLYLNLRTMF